MQTSESQANCSWGEGHSLMQACVCVVAGAALQLSMAVPPAFVLSANLGDESLECIQSRAGLAHPLWSPPLWVFPTTFHSFQMKEVVCPPPTPSSWHLSSKWKLTQWQTFRWESDKNSFNLSTHLGAHSCRSWWRLMGEEIQITRDRHMSFFPFHIRGTCHTFIFTLCTNGIFKFSFEESTWFPPTHIMKNMRGLDRGWKEAIL